MAFTEVGSVLDGKYEIVEPLGSGGMGEVLLARHLHLDELRVIKVLRRDLAADEASQKRFLREARLATQIKHPNVAILHDCTRLPQGAFYMVWEYVEGHDVGSWLEERGPFAVPQAIDLAIQALRGLEAIHATGVIHRDVSPDNLMIFRGPRGSLRLKIIDLGLARALAPDPNFEITQAGTFTGKLAYCSPEQARMAEGERLDRRTDLYSLGLVLYEMVCGEQPFGGRGPAAVYKRVEEEPIPLARRNPEVAVPAALDRVVMQALEREPAERFADAVSFIEALDRVREGLEEASTREVPAVRQEAASGPGAAGDRSGRSGGQRSGSGELSRQERQALLAQIDRAARRVKEGTVVIEQAQEALNEGRLAEARTLIERLEQANPGAPGLAELKAGLREAEERASDEHRVRELETMLGKYIQGKQKPLAEMALESLLELRPLHPRRSDYEAWVEGLDEEVEQDAKVEAALEEGRSALADDDFKRARRRLDALRKLDDEAAERFAAELARAEGEAEEVAEVEERRRRFEELVEEGELEAATTQLRALEGKVSRLTLDGYRERLDDARRAAARQEAEEEAESRFRERVAERDWAGAREVVHALGERFPGSERARELAEALARREEQARRRAAVEDGERQVEALIEAGDVDQAELALKVLLQLDPENPHRRKYARRIESLRG